MRTNYTSQLHHLSTISSQLPMAAVQELSNQVILLGSASISAMPDKLIKCSESCDTVDSMFELLQPHILGFLNSQSLQPSPGITIDTLRSALVCMVIHWFGVSFAMVSDDCILPSTEPLLADVWDRRDAWSFEGKLKEQFELPGDRVKEGQTFSTPPPSPTRSLEDVENLTPQVKVNVLRNCMDALNKEPVRVWNETWRVNVIKYHPRSLEAARRLFAANPTFTVSQLSQFFHASIHLLENIEIWKTDPSGRHLRRCWNLAYLLKQLKQVAEEWPHFPEPFRFLSKGELFGTHDRSLEDDVEVDEG